MPLGRLSVTTTLLATPFVLRTFTVKVALSPTSYSYLSDTLSMVSAAVLIYVSASSSAWPEAFLMFIQVALAVLYSSLAFPDSNALHVTVTTSVSFGFKTAALTVMFCPDTLLVAVTPEVDTPVICNSDGIASVKTTLYAGAPGVMSVTFMVYVTVSPTLYSYLSATLSRVSSASGIWTAVVVWSVSLL